MQSVGKEVTLDWNDAGTGVTGTPAGGDAKATGGEWMGTPLRAGMKAVYQRLRQLADSIAAAPLDIRVDYEVPQAEPLLGLRQAGYELLTPDRQLRYFSFKFRCVGKQRYSLREASRPARDERVRWLTQRGMHFHVEDAFGSQWHFSLVVRPIVPVTLHFEADIAQQYLRITLSNLDALETTNRSVHVDAITPEMLDALERMILRRPHRFEEFTGDRVDSEVRARLREKIDERRRSRAQELGENETGPAEQTPVSRKPVTAPTFVGPRDDDGALEWNTATAESTAAAAVAPPPPNPNAPPAYGWLITAGGVVDTAANLGRHGPPGASRHFPLQRLLTEGQQFRLRDRDGKIAFTGKITGEFRGPEPITDFGLDHGCLRIEYLRGDKWLELKVKQPG